MFIRKIRFTDLFAPEIELYLGCRSFSDFRYLFLRFDNSMTNTGHSCTYFALDFNKPPDPCLESKRSVNEIPSNLSCLNSCNSGNSTRDYLDQPGSRLCE